MESATSSDRLEVVRRTIASLRLQPGAPHPCPYLAGRESRNVAFQPGPLPSGIYHTLMDLNFRRSGQVVYRPTCDGCTQCRMIRVPTDAFRPARSQRRCWQHNQDLEVRCARPEPTPAKHDLYRRYLVARHDRQMSESWDDFAAFLYDSPANTLEMECKLGEIVVAVGLIDMEPQALSTVYCYYEPNLPQRSLGTFNILATIALAAHERLPWVYLGYHVAECPAMNYKARFRPCELLMPDGQWQRLCL